MKFFSADLQDLRELYNNSLQKALDMEKHITKALPTMIEKSTDPELKQAFETHLRETEAHVTRLETILNDTTGEASTIKCKVVASLVSEAEDSIKDAGNASVRDVVLIAAGQQVEHHEIAVYGTLRDWAEILGQENHASLLEQTLDEEKNADTLLTEISNKVNYDAESPEVRAA
jgi:ferritin-like metal-binding protein YciE